MGKLSPMFHMLSIEQYLDQVSDNDIDKAYYREMIQKYRNECGCSLSAIFLFIALIAFTTYHYFVLSWDQLNIVPISLTGLAFILLSALAGKAVGVGVAKLRLNLLYKALVHTTAPARK